MKSFRLVNWILVFLLCSSLSLVAKVQRVGFNLSSSEWGVSIRDGGAQLPGQIGFQYRYPTFAEIDYFVSRGFNLLRIPCRLERLQHALNMPLDCVELSNLNAVVSYAVSKGMFVVVDVHNYGRIYPDQSNTDSVQSGPVGVIGNDVSISDFANFWFFLAANFKNNAQVGLELMNEPNAMDTDRWVSIANAAIAAIRQTGATNLIVVPGNRYSGAWSWTNRNDTAFNVNLGRANSEAMLQIVDPGTNFVITVHQYFDFDYSGTHADLFDSSVCVGTFTNVTAWARSNHLKLFLGEFAIANSLISTDPDAGTTLTNVLQFLDSNSDVWMGWCWWAGGPWWDGGPESANQSSEYMFLADPAHLGQTNQMEKPSVSVLRNFIPVPSPRITLISNNQFQFPTSAGFEYKVQIASNLVSTNWTDYLTVFGSNNSSSVVTATNQFGSEEYFRVQIQLAP